MVTTLRADDLQPGDQIRLVGVCTVIGVDRPVLDENRLATDRRIVRVRLTSGRELPVWLWLHSRIEILSDLNGRGHLVTPVHAAVEAESMEPATT